MKYSETYAQIRALRTECTRESAPAIHEELVRCIWYDRLFNEQNLCLDDGRSLRIVSPGWWNRGSGPDFRNAQLEINGKLRTGDVEIHLSNGGWRQHGHHINSHFDEVILNVVLETSPPRTPIANTQNERIPSLLLGNFVEEDLFELNDRLCMDDYPDNAPQTQGQCSAITKRDGPEAIIGILELAGDWRMLHKARTMRERMDHTDSEQALYETFMSTCGFSHFKHHFSAIARQLPYERARQLAHKDPLLLETALLQVAGLLPNELPEGTTSVPHFARLRALKRDELGGLKSIPLPWKRAGVRPNNYPERRLAGAARFVARTASRGLEGSLERLWIEDHTPRQMRLGLEALFPKASGFWATHCSWTSKRLARPTSPLGAGRIRSIIGNVFVPAALAKARKDKDRIREEKIFDFFSSLLKEPDNRIIKAMLPRLFGGAKTKPRINFRLQQGILQTFTDWCEPNPSCRNCKIIPYLKRTNSENYPEL